MSWKELGRQWSDLRFCPYFIWKDWVKPRWTSVGIVGFYTDFSWKPLQ